MRADDIAPLFAAASGTPPLSMRQGIVREWDPATAQNKVEVAGVLLTDLPILNTNEALQLQVGDVVAIITWGASWAILGRLTIPGTPAAASALKIISDRIVAASNSDDGFLTAIAQNTFTNLSGTSAGPSVTTTIGVSGKALVFFGCELLWGYPVPDGIGAFASVEVSGATSIGASRQWGVGMEHTPVDEANIFTASKHHLFTGLNPGSTTFTMRYNVYSSNGATPTATFRERDIAVFAL